MQFDLHIFLPIFTSTTYLFGLTDAGSLYTNVENVLELNWQNFDELIYDQPKVALVQFYSDWCGHCRRYAPKFTRFAREVRHWQPLLSVVVVNCGDAVNTELCRAHGIPGTPTIKIIPYQASSVNQSQFFNGAINDVDEMLFDVADILHEQIVKHSISDWPNMKTLPLDASLSEVDVRNDVKTMLVVVQHLDPRLGYALSLDLHSKSKVRLVLVEGHHTILQSLPPATQAATFDVDKLKLAERTFKGSNVVQLRRNILLTLTPASTDASVTTSPVATTTLAPVDPYNLHLLDLLSGLGYMLRQEIPMKQTISGKRLETLLEFTALLKKHFPSADPKLLALLSQLNVWLEKQRKSGAVTGREWAKKMMLLEKQHDYPLLLGSHWQSCRGSLPRYRGYTCSVWMMFHALTVKAYQDSDKTHPLKTIRPIVGYVQHLFGCRNCSRNFMKRAGPYETTLNNPSDSIVWLWQMHNKANADLSDDVETLDPNYPKLPFPPVYQCPQCRNWEIETSENQIHWNQTTILEFMVDFYSKVNETQVEQVLQRDRALFRKREKKLDRLKSDFLESELPPLYSSAGVVMHAELVIAVVVCAFVARLNLI